MHFGAFMEFGSRTGVSEAQAFQEGFRMVDSAEEMGLDGVCWPNSTSTLVDPYFHRPSSSPHQ